MIISNIDSFGVSTQGWPEKKPAALLNTCFCVNEWNDGMKQTRGSMRTNKEKTNLYADSQENTWRIQRSNSVYYAVREGSFAAAALLISGTFVQLYLSQQGVSTVQIGTFNTILGMVSLVSTMLLSDIAERRANALRQSDGILLSVALLFLCYAPLSVALPRASIIWLLVTGVASVQIILAAVKSVLDYKMLYQIIDIERYGAVASMTGVSIGLFGMAYSWFFARMLALLSFQIAFLAGFASAMALVLLAYYCNRKMRVIHDPFVPAAQTKPGVKAKLGLILAVLRQPEFRVFVVPNTLRGVTIGILNSLVLIALELGVSAKTAANLAMVGSLGYLLASLAYNALSRAILPKYLGLAGAVLLCAVVLLPYSGTGKLFLFVAMLGYMGRTLVDYAVPSMVFQLIDPAVSGVYNAWRTVLFSIAAAGMSYLVGALLGKIPTVLLLILCASGYLICAIWYLLATRRFIKNPASSEAG